MSILKSIDPGFKKASTAITSQIERRGLRTRSSWRDGVMVIEVFRDGNEAFQVALRPLSGGLEAAIANAWASSFKFSHSQRYAIRNSHQSLTTALDRELERHPVYSPYEKLDRAYDAETSAEALKAFLVDRFGHEVAREILEAAKSSLDEEYPSGP